MAVMMKFRLGNDLFTSKYTGSGFNEMNRFRKKDRLLNYRVPLQGANKLGKKFRKLFIANQFRK